MKPDSTTRKDGLIIETWTIELPDDLCQTPEEFMYYAIYQACEEADTYRTPAQWEATAPDPDAPHIVTVTRYANAPAKKGK